MFHLFLDEVDDGLVVDEVDVLEPDLLVGVHRLLLLERVPFFSTMISSQRQEKSSQKIEKTMVLSKKRKTEKRKGLLAEKQKHATNVVDPLREA